MIQQVAIKEYQTLIAPLANYANLFLCSGPSKLLKKVNTPQNAAIRIIYCKNNRYNEGN